jgi:primosomal protein N' (replication factor Y) (superfamily II helicase)
VLALDRPFTYAVPPGMELGVGSLVQVRFHGRRVRAWVLGPATDPPDRVAEVEAPVSPVRFFDPGMLRLLRWVRDRYAAPLASVIARAIPPRVVGEEQGWSAMPAGGPRPTGTVATSRLDGYRGGPALADALTRGSGAFRIRPAPEEEAELAVEAVARCLAGGRRAIVLVPEARPLPATARAIHEAFGDRVTVLAGGDRRARYRRWLGVLAGRGDVVVGTRPAVFAPVPDLGLLYVSRESHAAHREDRAPYYHVRDVAGARAELGMCVMAASALCPSADLATASGVSSVEPAGRRWPPVEIVRPGPEGRAPRLVRSLRGVRRAFVLAPVPGYGVAQVCRACGATAACAACGGALRVGSGAVACVVCEAPGRCARCGADRFGIRRGGAERVEEWASGVASVPVRRIETGRRARLPGTAEVLIGGADAVRDLGPGGLDLVAVLDIDLAKQRPGLDARERAVAVAMEAVGWARPAGRAIVPTAHAADAGVQAIVRGNADRFLAEEAGRRAAAGFPVGSPVFRVAGRAAIVPELEALEPITLLVTASGEQTVCLLALEPRKLPGFGSLIRRLAARDIVTRVEAEPHL